MTQAFNLSQLANNVNTSGLLNAAAGLYNQLPVANGGTGLSTATGALVGAGSTMSAIAAGTTGNVLTSNGTTWTSAVSAGGPAPVVTIYTSPSPWTKSPTLKFVKVSILSGGGSGANARSPTAASNGGASGAYGWGYFPAPSIPGPVTVTVGTGGASTTINTVNGVVGNSGTSSSFGALISATGGSGGTYQPAFVLNAGGVITPSPTVIGGSGYPSPGFTNSNGTTGALVGAPSSNNFGIGGAGGGTTASPGTGFGAGGGGVASPNNSGVTSTSGAGTSGFVIVEEFY